MLLNIYIKTNIYLFIIIIYACAHMIMLDMYLNKLEGEQILKATKI